MRPQRPRLGAAGGCGAAVLLPAARARGRAPAAGRPRRRSAVLRRQRRRYPVWGYAPSSFDLGPRRQPDGNTDTDVADFLRWTLGTIQHVRVGQQRAAALARQLRSEFERLRQEGFECGPQAYNQAISLLTRWGRNIEGREMLEDMRRLGIVDSAEPYEELMKGYAMCGDLIGVQQVVKEMQGSGWAITKQSYNYLLMAFAKRGEQQNALKVLDAMVADDIAPDRMSYHWTIMACNSYARAREVFNAMSARGIMHNDQSYTALLKTCVKAGDAANSLLTLEECIRDGMRPPSTAFNQVMRLHLKPLDLDKVAAIYHRMRGLEVDPDFVTYCIFIRACKLDCRGGEKADAKLIALAEAAFAQARRDGVDHREVHRELLALYNKVGDRARAEALATEMLRTLPGDNRTTDMSPSNWG